MIELIYYPDTLCFQEIFSFEKSYNDKGSLDIKLQVFTDSEITLFYK